MFKVCGMCKMGHHLWAHLKALGRGLLMSVHGFPWKKSFCHPPSGKKAKSLTEAPGVLTEQVYVHWGKIQMSQGSLLTGELPTGRRLLAIPARTKVFPGFPRGKQGSKPACKRIPSCLTNVSEARLKWVPGICIVSKHPRELCAGSHIAAWPPFVYQNA